MISNFAPNDEKLAEQLKLVKWYSDDFQMEFGLDKCAKCTFVQWRPTKMDSIKIDINTIQELENQASYKYLGVEEGHQICLQQMYKTIAKE